MEITRRDVDALYQPVRDAHRYISAQRDEGSGKGNVTGRLVQAAEVSAGAAALGLLYGRLGQSTIPGTPIPMGLAIGAAAHLADYFGVVGNWGSHVVNVGNGAFASWATMIGAGYGQRMRADAGQPIGNITAGAIGCCDGAPPPRQLMASPTYSQRPTPMTEAELISLSSGIR